MQQILNLVLYYIIFCFVCDTLVIILETPGSCEDTQQGDKVDTFTLKERIEMHFISLGVFVLSPLFLVIELAFASYDMLCDFFEK